MKPQCVRDSQRVGRTWGGRKSMLLLAVAGTLLVSGCETSPAGHVGGIGLQLGMPDGSLTVMATIKDTPAFQAGLLPGDIIVDIDGEATRTMTLPEAVNKVRGKTGTTVKLKSLRPSTQETKEYTIIREDIRYAPPQPGQQNSPGALPATLPLPAESAAPF